MYILNSNFFPQTTSDSREDNIPSHHENKTVLATPNYCKDEKVLFYLLYGEHPNYEGRICLFNSSTFEVEIVEKFSTWVNPCEIATGEDKVFLIRGLKKVFEIFNYVTKQLTKGPDPPEWRWSATVAYYKNKLYYIGGYDSTKHQISASVNILVDGKWQRGSDFPISVLYASHVICNDKLYIISKNAVFQLSDDERKWIEVGNMKGERWRPAVASLNGKIYITGGYRGDALHSCLCFDPSQPSDKRFTSIANMNFKRQDHPLVVANGKLYAIGGYQEVFNVMSLLSPLPSLFNIISQFPSISSLFSPFSRKFCKSVEEYDPATNRWQIVKEIE